MRFTAENERTNLITRMVVMSFIVHFVLSGVLVGATLLQKRPRIVPIRLISVYSPPVKAETLATKRKAQPAEKRAEPQRPIRTIEAESRKIVYKKPEEEKKQVKPKTETKKKVVATPKPTATPRRAEVKKPPAPRRTPAPRVAAAPAPPRATPALPPPPVPQVAGPLTMESLELPDYYMISARQKIEGYFSVPGNVKNREVICKATFKILKDGRITNIRLVQSTGDALLDQAAVRALTLTRELGPLPDSISKSSIDTIITFDYSADW